VSPHRTACRRGKDKCKSLPSRSDAGTRIIILSAAAPATSAAVEIATRDFEFPSRVELLLRRVYFEFHFRFTSAGPFILDCLRNKGRAHRVTPGRSNCRGPWTEVIKHHPDCFEHHENNTLRIVTLRRLVKRELRTPVWVTRQNSHYGGDCVRTHRRPERAGFD
jgi:hypothetical protein